MARLAITKNFLDQYGKLEKSVQKATWSAISEFEKHTHAGLHLEKIRNSRDPRMRTIRIDLHWRGVVLAPDSGEAYALLAVLPHDEAIAYAQSRRCSVNQVLGVWEVRDEQALEQVLAPPAPRSASLFGHVSDRELRRLGIDDAVLTVARMIQSEGALDAVLPLLPEAQGTALLCLASGMTVEETWQQVAQYLPAAGPPGHTADLVAAMRRTPSQVVFVTGHEELRAILENPFAAWRVFLHPTQRTIAFAPRYAGPVQVTGGAGTGKTVTALHRTAFLAERAATALFTRHAAERPVLLTTFTRNLADALSTQFASLAASDEIRAQVDIVNVDRLAYHIVERAHGTRPAIATSDAVHEVWMSADDHQSFSPVFLNREWEQVILAQDLHTEQAYLACSRKGQGIPLGKAQRAEVWRIAQRAVAALRERGLWTHLQLANEAAHLVRESLSTPYQHVIVDEAQDLHPAQWRLLRALVLPGPDDMFIVGDPHQRIYQNHVSLARLGVNVRGRSRRLTMNYRTTQEILGWTVPLLGTEPVTGLDDEVDKLTGYRSPMHGRPPLVRCYPTPAAELAGLAAQVRDWLDAGIEPEAIGVAARRRQRADEAIAALKADGVKVAKLTATGPRAGCVRAGTMHAMKGLEFQAVAVIGVSDGEVPAVGAITPPQVDPVAHALDLQRERCLLFVACTRARDHLYVSAVGAPSPFLPPKER